jgi:hypothetical protein
MVWDGELEWYNNILLVFYLAVIALGFGAAWKRWRWIGLLPLAYNLGYALSNGISRFSGWRYDFPADWVPYFYFGIGFAEILIIASTVFGVKEEISQGIDSYRRNIPIPAYFALFALIGALPWVAEKVASPQYTDQSIASLSGQIASIPSAPTNDEIVNFASQPDAYFQIGRLLYPRFFSRDKGIFSANPWPAYRQRDYPRLGFLLMNHSVAQAVFPSREIPSPFPHAGEAIVLGCQQDGYLEVRMIAFPELDTIHVSAPLSEPCTP